MNVVGSAPSAGLTLEAKTLLVEKSQPRNKQVVLHASSYEAYRQGAIANVDQIRHSTLDVPADEHLLRMIKESGASLCPTCTTMRAVVEQLNLPKSSLATANVSVAAMHAAHVPIVVGTDANMKPSATENVPFGNSLHDELGNMVAAAKLFGLPYQCQSCSNFYPASPSQIQSPRNERCARMMTVEDVLHIKDNLVVFVLVLVLVHVHVQI
ncbi:Adenine deaminase 2-like protein 2 [Seiridium cupressi]